MLEKIKTLLTDSFSPTHLEVVDQGHKHRNHPEAKKHGGGHFDVHIVSAAFAGKNSIERHRVVYGAVETLIHGGQIHALSIKAYTPEEHAKP